MMEKSCWDGATEHFVTEGTPKKTNGVLSKSSDLGPNSASVD